MAFTHAVSVNNWGTAKFIVSSTAANGTHTTIASALSDASSGDTIWIRPGTYTENLTMKAGVNLAAPTCDAVSPQVIIKGKCTFSSAGDYSCSGIEFRTNGDYSMVFSGLTNINAWIINCFINVLDHTAIQYTQTGSTNVYFMYCQGNTATTGITYLEYSGTGKCKFFYCRLFNDGASTTASTASSGGIDFNYCVFNVPLTISGTASLIFYHSNTSYTITVSSTNAQGTLLRWSESAEITMSNASTLELFHSHLLAAPGNSALTIGATGTAKVVYSTINSSAVNAIDGTGTLKYAFITYLGSSSTVAAGVTQTAYTTL